MTQTDTKKKAMIAALQQSLGVVTSACKAVGISRETHYKWLREDVDYKYQVEDLSNIALDFAESQLHNQIKNGSTPATIFYLKTKGKKRGYIERQEIQHENLEPLTIEIIDSTSEDE
tara:strand:- start:682 stop:1032 length:351 start_codon:yes stop_codon:yes gene_type:complete